MFSQQFIAQLQHCVKTPMCVQSFTKQFSS